MKTTFRTLGLSLVLPCLVLTTALSGCHDAIDDVPAQEVPEPSEELQADLQVVLDSVVEQGSTPGVALYVSERGATWAGAAGLAELEGATPMSPEQTFRAGSMVKSLVATAVLQQVEDGALELDAVLTELLPPSVTDRIAHAERIDVAMLLGHRSGIAEWVGPAVRQTLVSEPGHVWSLDEVLGLVEAQAPMFEPGDTFAYSNTNYALLGEILGAVDGRSWRDVVRERVIAAAGMHDTSLPEPGDVACPSCAHGYVPFDGAMLDATHVDPSMAGAAGGHALVSTPADLASFLEQLQAGALFEHADTLASMMALQPALDQGEAGGYLTGYGFGIMQLEVEGELVIGHLGGTMGYMGFMLYVPATDRYVSGYMNVMGDPSAVIVPLVERLAQADQ